MMGGEYMDYFNKHQRLLDGLVPNVSYIWYYYEIADIAIVADECTQTLDFMFFTWNGCKWNYGFSLNLCDTKKAMELVELIVKYQCDKSDLPF